MSRRRIIQQSIKLTNRYNLHRKLCLNNTTSYLDLRHLLWGMICHRFKTRNTYELEIRSILARNIVWRVQKLFCSVW